MPRFWKRWCPSIRGAKTRFRFTKTTIMNLNLLNSSDNIDELKMLVAQAFSQGGDTEITTWFSFPEMLISIEAKRGVCVQAYNDVGDLVGACYAQQESPINAQEGTEKWVIILAAVHPDFQSQGIGRSCLTFLENQTSQLGCKKMFVYTNKNDTNVVRFYKINGYTDAGWIKDYQHGESNSAVFLLKYL